MQPFIDYDLVIRHNNKDGTITRFKLWPFVVVGSEFLDIPRYTGQVIKKNFSIELWGLNRYGQENLLYNLFDTTRFVTEADAYGKIYYHDAGSADISQDNGIADYRLTEEGEYYYYYDPNDDGVTIYLNNGGNIVPNGTVFQAAPTAVFLNAPQDTVCTATIMHVYNPAINAQAILDAGLTSADFAQTKAYISLLKDKATLHDPAEFEEATVSSVPCTPFNNHNWSNGNNAVPIVFPECSAGLSNT